MSVTYFNCPYCGKEIYIELETQSQYGEYVDDCSECHKAFNYRVVISAEIDAYKKEDGGK